MTFGLVISSYNYGHLAAHCIESALCQTKKFDKIWFVDDGAGDCQRIVDLYSDRDIEFIIREQNMGIVANFNNMLVQKVNTDYVMYLGADNWLRPDALELLNYQIAKPVPDIITYDIIVTGELRDEIYKPYSSWMHKHEGDYYWSRRMQHHGSMMYNVKMAKKVGGYAKNNTSERTDEDLNLWDKMLKEGAVVTHFKQGLLYYRRHKENFNKY
jgi:glycosyltransferase involved in cell wall biosynthesis